MAARVGSTAGGRAGERRGAGMAASGGAQLRGARGRRVSLRRRSAKAGVRPSAYCATIIPFGIVMGPPGPPADPRRPQGRGA